MLLPQIKTDNVRCWNVSVCSLWELYFFIFFINCVFLVLILAVGDSPPIVDIPGLGKVEGRHAKSLNNKPFFSFEGVPYAEPPVGKNRFKVKYDICSFIDQFIEQLYIIQKLILFYVGSVSLWLVWKVKNEILIRITYL